MLPVPLRYSTCPSRACAYLRLPRCDFFLPRATVLTPLSILGVLATIAVTLTILASVPAGFPVN